MCILVYMYTYNRVTSICINLSKIKLFVIRYSFNEQYCSLHFHVFNSLITCIMRSQPH